MSALTCLASVALRLARSHPACRARDARATSCRARRVTVASRGMSRCDKGDGCSSACVAAIDRRGRGYFAARVTERQLQVDLRFVTSVADASGTGYHDGTFAVENGKPGAPEGCSLALSATAS